MSVRKIRGSWWVDFRYNGDRVRKRSPHNSKGSAEAFEAYLRQLTSQHGSIDAALETLRPKPNGVVPKFAEFAARWLLDYVEVNNKPSEQRAKRRIINSSLNPIFGKMRLNEIKTADTESYKAQELKRGMTAKTINNRLGVLRKCLATAVEWEILDRLPGIRPLKTTPPGFRYLREPEVQSIANACATAAERAMVLFAARTGVRFSELRALEWEDLDLTRRIVTIRRCAVGQDIGTPKSGRIRHIPLTNDVTDVLREIRSNTPASGVSLVFPRDGKMRAYWTSFCHLQEACKRTGIERVGWHTFRHTFASQLVTRGASMKAVQDLLGHSTVNMTQRYAHLAPEALRDAISLLEPVTSGQPAVNWTPNLLSAVELQDL